MRSATLSGISSTWVLLDCRQQMTPPDAMITMQNSLEGFNLSEHLDVLGGDKVDGNTLSAKSTTSTDSVDVVLLGGGEVVLCGC